MKTDGTEFPKQLTRFEKSTEATVRALTPSGLIVFESRGVTGKGHVYSMPVRGGVSPLQLTAPASGETAMFRLIFSDARHVVYTSNDRPGGFGETELYRVPVDTFETPKLITNFDNETYFMPRAFIPSSDQFIYSTPLDGDDDLFVTTLDGDLHRPLTQNGVADTFQGLSQCGRYAFYVNASIGQKPGTFVPQEIFYTRADGNGMSVRLTDNAVDDSVNAIVLDTRIP